MNNFPPLAHLIVFEKYKVTEIIGPKVSGVADVSYNPESDGFLTPRNQGTDTITMPSTPRKIRAV
jgi:hypothetical protein